jgi:flavodoxin
MNKHVLIILSSFHHKNTEKIAKAIAEVLSAEIKDASQISIEEIKNYDLIGFGSGTYDGHHHNIQLNLVDRLSEVKEKKAFLFSTTGAPKFTINDKFIKQNHNLIREKLKSKGYEMVGEFGCPGWNTNGFLRFFGGLNKSKPDEHDIKKAKEFASSLKIHI